MKTKELQVKQDGVMLNTIILKEIRDLISSTKFAITFGFTALLIIGAFYVGGSDFKLARTQYEASKAENLRQMDGLTDWFSLEQHRIFLPPTVLSSIVTGISNDIGRSTEVKTRGELIPEGSRFGEDPFLAIFRFLDLGFVFQVILSLFAILLGYDAISGEKERGTLKLSFANALPRATYIVGKFAGSFIALTLSLITAIALGSLLLPLMGVNMSGDEWLRLGMIVIAGLLYFGAFLSMSMFVSAVTHRTSSSFLFLLVIWVGAVLIIPRVSVMLAGHAVDVPSVDEIAAQKASFSRDLWNDFRTSLSDFEAPPMLESDDIEAAMAGFQQYMDSLTKIRDRKMDNFANRLNEERSNRQMVQEKTAFGFARVSPSASLAFATAEMAGTSIALKNRYKKEAISYRQNFNAFMKEKTGIAVHGRMIMIRESDEEGEEPKPIDPQELPVFKFNAASFAESFSAAAADFGLLAVFNLLFFAGAFTAFMRYDLR